MADKQMLKTTSSRTIDGNNSRRVAASLPAPKSSEMLIMTKLAHSLSASYQLVKQRQQKYNELSALTNSNCSASFSSNCSTRHTPDDGCSSCGEWQEVCSAKNKLKRKKKLSSSLTSVTDSVNQEKRTRIEGIQLNCRGRLQLSELVPVTCAKTLHAKLTGAPTQQRASGVLRAVENLASKPPLPPQSATKSTASTQPTNDLRMPPPRLKRKLEENIQTIQKLNALTDQLRLEINELKSNLTTERGAVRVLRAQNEAESRKWKNDLKKMQNSLDLLKKNSAVLPNAAKKAAECAEQPLPPGLANYEIQRLTNELSALKEANTALEERKSLEELKTKERNIGQLKKDLQTLQTKKPQNETKSRNATNVNVKQHQQQQLQEQKTKNNIMNKQKNSTKTKQNNEEITTIKVDIKEQPVDEAQQPNEMKKLKDIELINNTKNVQNNVNQKPTNIFTPNNNTNTIAKSINSNNNFHKIANNNSKPNNMYTSQHDGNKYQNNATTIMMHNDENYHNLTMCGHQREYHSLPHELTERLLATSAATPAATREEEQGDTARTKEQNDVHEYTRTKDNNSDSDSALSSAPPSISPQPPPAGMDTADIWQTIRTYTTDIEKLQKDVEFLQKENEQLRKELSSANEQIVASDKIAREANNNGKLNQLLERIKYLEEQEHHLHEESDELREQNELLEFRILELEETNDKWSLQSHTTPSASVSTGATSTTQTTAIERQATQDVWGTSAKPNKDDPMQLLFGHNRTVDSGIISPNHNDDDDEDDDLHLIDGNVSGEELRQRIANMLQKPAIDVEDRQCLQQVLLLVQQLELNSPQNSSSGPDSLNTNSSSSDDACSLEMVKSRISDYSSASSSSSASASASHSRSGATAHTHNATVESPKVVRRIASSRIVATVQPYNSSAQQPPPTNTPTESPRKCARNTAWQSNSLSESGVFVESDFLSDTSENNNSNSKNTFTQTDFDEEEYDEDDALIAHTAKELCSELQRLQRKSSLSLSPAPPYGNSHTHPPTHHSLSLLRGSAIAEKRLLYYQQRVELLERKVLIYESSGDLQAKRLADRLQREIQLEKQLHELHDRVDFLECENATLDEEKCEFEEAENDTRLRLQRLEVELEILSQRNVELEMSREALSAKYKDCRSECLILRDDLSVSETQIRHLEEDKQKAKENFEFLHSALPLLLLYNSIIGAVPVVTDSANKSQRMGNIPPMGDSLTAAFGNATGTGASTSHGCERSASLAQFERDESMYENSDCCLQRELLCLREEVSCLRHQLKELNSRHYEALESADSHWVDLEREYKDREIAFRAKEHCLKQKINKLQDCLRDDARAANEKITQLEEAEKELKACMLRLSKEHRDNLIEHKNAMVENEQLRQQNDSLKDNSKPLSDALEMEKKRCKTLTDEINFMRKLQQESESRNTADTDALRLELREIRKEFLHIEVTNSELKEEVATLEQQLTSLQNNEKEYLDKMRCLADEVATKEEMCKKLEKRLERSEGYSLADELNGSPSKRFKREEIRDLKTATQALGSALRNMKDCEKTLPTHQQFQVVARDVKKLADTLLHGGADVSEEEVSKTITDPEEEVNKTITEPEEEVSKTITEPEGEVSKAITEPEEEVSKTITEPEEEKTVEPAEASAPAKEQSQEDVEPEQNDTTVTVGLALVHNFAFDFASNFLPSFMRSSKEQICEVPSEMRKLSPENKFNIEMKTAATSAAVEVNNLEEPQARRRLTGTTRGRKRSAKRPSSRWHNVGMYVGFRRTLHERVRRIVSCMNEESPCRFRDVSDIDICHSEVLQRCESFHSLQDDFPEHHPSNIMIDASTETICEKFDRGTEYQVEQVESGVQVNDEMNPEKLIKCIPSRSRSFLKWVRSTVPDSDIDLYQFNSAILEQWQNSTEFRDGLNVLRKFFSRHCTTPDLASSGSYEQFVSAMTCLHGLDKIFKPIKVALLNQIQEQINEQLMTFHTRQMESEFYCTVYYPVKRRTPFPLTDFIVNPSGCRSPTSIGAELPARQSAHRSSQPTVQLVLPQQTMHSSSCQGVCRGTTRNATEILYDEGHFMDAPCEYEGFYDCFSHCDVPHEGSALKVGTKTQQAQEKQSATSCMINNNNTSASTAPGVEFQNVLRHLKELGPFRNTLKDVMIQSQKLLKSFDEAMRKEALARSRVDATAQLPRAHMQTRTIQLEVNACIHSESGNNFQLDPYRVRVDPVQLLIPLRIQMQTPRADAADGPAFAASTARIPPASVCQMGAQHFVELTPTPALSISQAPAKKRVAPCGPPDKVTCSTRSVQKVATSSPILGPCACLLPVAVARPVQPCPAPPPPPEIIYTSLECICTQEPPPPPPSPPTPPPLPDEIEEPCVCAPPKKYRLALPQHKDMKLCSPCRFHPSPLMDEDGRVFCPGGCPCCLCPWHLRATESLEDRIMHDKIKVCRCRQKGTIFTEFDLNDPHCSVNSMFDVCPCQEKAEAKYLELYHHQMWAPDEKLLEKLIPNMEVEISDVVELRPAVAPKPKPKP